MKTLCNTSLIALLTLSACSTQNSLSTQTDSTRHYSQESNRAIFVNLTDTLSTHLEMELDSVVISYPLAPDTIATIKARHIIARHHTSRKTTATATDSTSTITADSSAIKSTTESNSKSTPVDINPIGQFIAYILLATTAIILFRALKNG